MMFHLRVLELYVGTDGDWFIGVLSLERTWWEGSLLAFGRDPDTDFVFDVLWLRQLALHMRDRWQDRKFHTHEE